MRSLKSVLENDPVWQKLKTEQGKIAGEKLLTKVEYLKEVGHENFTHKGYKEYVRKHQQAIEKKEKKENG